jgi:hypothetical protein
MQFPRRFAALSFALLFTLVSVGFVHGLWTKRWDASSEQDISEMEKLPMEVGAWVGQTAQDDAAKQLRADSKNFLSRRYVNRTDGAVANVMLTRGRPGPMVIKHLPTECYESAGYQLVGKPKHYSTQTDVSDEFWVATFKKTTDVMPIIVRVYWSWSATGRWQTPDRPRLTFARYPTLYKLYVVQNVLDENEPSETAPVHELIKELTNAMRGSVFSSGPR